MKIYALTTLKRYAIEIDVRLFDSIEQCQDEYDFLIKNFELGFRKKNGKNYIVNRGYEHTEIKYDESLEILFSIQTYELNDLVNNQVYCVIKGNQDCYKIDNENLYLFKNETKATKRFFDLLIEHEEYGYGIEDVQIKYNGENKEYFSFDNTRTIGTKSHDYDWGHCKTELIKIKTR